MKVISPVDISHATDTAWTDVDVTSHVGGDAGSVAGVVVYARNLTGTDYDIGLRKNGSSDTIIQELQNDSHSVFLIGVDSNDVLEIYVEDASEVAFWLLGYATTAEAEFSDNATDFTPGSDDTWTDADISSITGANTAAVACGIIENTSSAGGRDFAFRPNGSTDTRTSDQISAASIQGFNIPCDGSEIFEAYVGDTSDQNVWVTGWIYANTTTQINATEYGVNSSSTWEEKDVSGDVGASDIALCMVASRGGGSIKTMAFRRPGDSIPVEEIGPQAYYGWSGLDVDQDVELITSGKNGVEFWAYGGFAEPAGGGGDTDVSANTDSLTLTEFAASISLDVGVAAAVTALTLSTFSADINAATNVQAGVDSLTLTEQQASVNAETNIQAATDALTLTELQATIEVGGDTNVQASTDALTLTEQAATVNAETNVQAAVDALTLTENQATVSLAVDIQAATDALTLTEQSATVNAETNVQANTDSLTLTTYQTSIIAGGVIEIQAGTASLTLATQPATVTVSDPNVIDVAWTEQDPVTTIWTVQRTHQDDVVWNGGTVIWNSGEVLWNPVFKEWSEASSPSTTWTEQ